VAETGKVYPVDTFVVLSRATAHKLGQLRDFIVNPVDGALAGISVKVTDGSFQYVGSSEIYSIGPDAFMLKVECVSKPLDFETISDLIDRYLQA
jgi:uncharacterized protein YrrD